MKCNNRFIQYIEDIVLNELKKPKYGFEKSVIDRIEKLYNYHEIYYLANTKSPFERSKNNLDIKIYTYSSLYLKTINIKFSSKVFDFVPCKIDGNLVELRPVLCIEYFEDMNSCSLLKVIVHEICHLYSIGSYCYSNKKYIHNFGINQYIYKQNKIGLVCTYKKVYAKLNEIINDCISNYICSQILGYNTYSIYASISDYKKYVNYITDNIILVINLYFSGQSDILIKLLEYENEL